MKKVLSGFTLALAIAAANPAGATDFSQAVLTVERYSSSFSRFDCGALLQDISPRVKQSIEAQGGFAAFCSTIASFAGQGVQEELIREMRSEGSGSFRLAVFPNRRVVLDHVRRKRIVTEGTYVVHSSDGGTTWYVLDVACLDPKWLQVLYPPYKGNPPVGPAQLRVEDLRD